ncbi:MAG: S-methyl-5'-thioadenosine phosphorylase [Pseudomonadota bacterium]|jgi:5'-methylthioadenosine phosphorylase|uniref:S-methyl-5'-thioadenosine phosphorylase n=1 Tax=Sphingobium sp. CECT 9361 TaxID=2845384 RepID=UPI001E5E7864|nr:S-methyl-5'-thioadenosine phosphorylase [Sphingobium sp. CECT 9361]CAH0356193.1 S-methyl-5'-thioadenosine phosphorylase [Sphingobium sp. CECT 9361]
MGEWTIGIIGGSGLYRIEGLEDAHWVAVTTPWGKPSDEFLVGHIEGVRCVFLPRHGRGHYLGPSDLNSRANIDAMKRLGVTDILSISAVGSLREELPPGHFVIADQFIDRTFGRAKSFFGKGLVAHVSLADPVCPRLSDLAAQAARAAKAPTTLGATYLAMEGPQFSTRAESALYRQWGCDVIGMTAMPEAKLAREAELPYALVGMVTDYDCWRTEEAGVEVTDVLRVLNDNAALARRLVLEFIALLPSERTASPIDTCLDHALITAQEARDPETVARLDAVAGRLLR